MTAAEFEREVRELLQLQGWRVTTEVLLGHKKVDAYAERPDALGTIQRVAIECKKWDGLLSQNDVTFIHVNYKPLIDANQVDLVLIVTQAGLSPSATTYVSNSRTLRHLTYLELLNTLIDFRTHIQGMLAGYLADQVSQYYVPQSFSGADSGAEVTLEQYLLDWVASSDYQPISVLGGYGSGKTTLVKRMAYLLAKQCAEDPNGRIPVVLPLATIATDQTLEGLLGRQFTSVTICPNYNFQLFNTLNARGRFVFFLDGFDEMKKTMSWDSLLFNLTQLNQLATPMSKVVLLGRPSAFLSSDEQDEALHGKLRRLGQDRHLPGWPDYREIHLRPFTRQQVASFIHKCLQHLPDSTQDQVGKRRRVTRYLENLESPQGKRLLDLAARPVQLRMLMELLPEYTGPIDRLTVALLYSEFIDLLLRRESAKPARAAFSRAQRLRFAAHLAFWMWQDEQRSDIDVTNIPDMLFGDYLDKKSGDIQLLDLKRDLLSGGFLDRKPPNVFFFPHRSFQEYLVAEELRYRLEQGESLTDCPFLTPEVTSFFIELVGRPGTVLLRKRWSLPSQPGENLRELINTACAHYGLELLGQSSTVASDKEREALLRKLDIVGVVKSQPDTRGKQHPTAETKKLRTVKRRKAGSTRKHKYGNERSWRK
jgi:NACHT domain-containing protein/restriction endonuclease